MRVKRHYKIILEDESRLVRLAEMRTTPLRLAFGALGVVCLLLILAMGIVMVTPLRTLLPGYLKEEERDISLTAMVEIDSLQRNYEMNQRYLDNLVTVLDLSRDGKADSAAIVPKENPMSPDSIAPASAREKRFTDRMREKERFNISVLAPLAAEGMEFSPVAEGAIFDKNTLENPRCRVIIPHDMPVQVVTDGIVADISYKVGKGSYTVIVLHQKGFVSRYDGIGSPLVAEGQKLLSGQPLGLADYNSGRTSDVITLEIWRNGEPLLPAKFLKRPVTSDKVQ